jgi:hypothetical protein
MGIKAPCRDQRGSICCRIDAYTENRNRSPKPFVWTATPTT